MLYCFKPTYLPIKVVLQLLVKCGDTLAKTCKFWNDQVIAKYLDQKGQISRQNKLELFQIQIKGLQADVLFWSVFAHVFNHFFQPFISCWFYTSSPDFLKKKFTNVRDIKTRNHEFTNSPIHEFKVLHRGQRAFSNLFLMVNHFLFITLKNILSLTFSF